MTCKNEMFGHDFPIPNSDCTRCGINQADLSGSLKTSRGREYTKEKEELGKYKIDYSFQAYCIEIRDYFPKGQEKLLWKTFHDYFENDIRKAFRVCQDKNILDVKYLRGVLKNI